MLGKVGTRKAKHLAGRHQVLPEGSQHLLFWGVQVRILLGAEAIVLAGVYEEQVV